MPPRPPLSSSSSFRSTFSPAEVGRPQRSSPRLSYDSNRQSYNQGSLTPLPGRVMSERGLVESYPREPLASPYDEVQTLSSGEFSTSYNKEEEDAGTAMLYSGGYGGAGFYSEPQRGRIRTSAQGYSNNGEKRTMNESPTKKNGNMTKQIGLWLASCYIFRHLVYITSFGLVLWVPGLVALLIYGASSQNNFNRPAILSVGLFWWSIWLSSAWVGIWVCSIIANVTPKVIRRILGVVAVAFKNYIDYAEATQKYIAFLLWSVLVWIVYLSTVWSQFPGSNTVDGTTINPLSSSNLTNATTTSSTSSTTLLSALSTLHPTLGASKSQNVVYSSSTLQANEAWLVCFSRFFAGVVICSAILLAEKVAMQWVALSFHQTTYSDRIETSNYSIQVLTTLLSHLSPTSSAQRLRSGATDLTLGEKNQGNLSSIFIRAQKFKNSISNNKAIKSISIPLQSSQFPFSAQATVETTLESASQSKKLAKQIFHSFANSKDTKTGDNIMKEKDIAGFFSSDLESRKAFTIFDRENNQSCTWEDLQSSILDIHQERVCLLASLHDVDSAVLKLDNFFMSFYLFLSCVVIAALLSTKISTLLASLGTILLGLSWLVGSTLQESLASIVWVFGKHPVDVGDTIEVPGLLSGSKDCEEVFIVEEIQLLSTVLKTITGRQIQISNYQLAQKPIINIRRSGPMEEKFTLSVEYNTPFGAIESLRQNMIKWISDQKRDFLPGLNIELNCLNDQSKLELILEIRYKSNWQDEHLKARRKNKWIVALKDFMAQLEIYGPAGKPNKINQQSQDDNENYHARVESFSLMDKRDAARDGQFSQEEETSANEQPVVSKLNDGMLSAPRCHTGPTTQITSLNVRGRRGEDERVGDLERGTSW